MTLHAMPVDNRLTIVHFGHVHVQNVRVSEAIVDRADRVARAMEERTPGIQVSRADAIRAALALGLPLLERELGVQAEGCE